MLASAAANRLVVWDLSYTRGPIDSWEHISSPSTNITSVSWSRSPDIIGSSSDTGLITLFDIRDKLPSISLKKLNRPSSCIQFSPTNEHELVISFSDSSEEHSVWSWDTRSSNNYLWKSCDRCQGTRSLSWSNKGDLILIGTNNSRIIVFSVLDQKVISEFCTTTACLDLEWSHAVQGSFFASFNKKLTAYVLE